MATITAKLTLDSTTVSVNETLGLSVTDTLTTTNPTVGLSQIVLTTAATNIVPTSSSAVVYFYAKNTDTTNAVVLETIDGTQAFADLAPGEFCFFPVKGLMGVRAKSAASTAVLEHAYYTKG
jgi:hypothetical protein|tara:strand:+ start:100 stop:465 length:366 start_codon:yes stop_codon:yes gene_type:complete